MTYDEIQEFQAELAASSTPASVSRSRPSWSAAVARTSRKSAFDALIGVEPPH
ncbi:hypothetical protein [Sinorhizobium meliloti]|uniref:hypothetical protein n=1 Tax=Rhizobium meliloti TaxID=382 RepID=UPI001F3E7DDA|nr:hypothetical protein [Sinorhizobium meliloti]